MLQDQTFSLRNHELDDGPRNVVPGTSGLPLVVCLHASLDLNCLIQQNRSSSNSVGKKTASSLSEQLLCHPLVEGGSELMHYGPLMF